MSSRRFHSVRASARSLSTHLWLPITAAVIALGCARSASASVTLPVILSDHMVVQRDQPIHIWGWAELGEDVTVLLNGQQRETHADPGGTWSVDLPPMKSGGPFQMTVTGKNVLKVSDILVGDLWVASGQSNMEFPVSGFPGVPLKDSAHEIETANHPEIRLFHVEGASTTYPMVDFEQKGGWMVCTPESVAHFSAVAYFFGREINAVEKVPVGLVDSSWGGTPAESWISLPGITTDAALAPAFDEFNVMAAARGDELKRWQREDADDVVTRSLGQTPPQRNRNRSFAGSTPAALYNGMIAPLQPMHIRGVIWYQGESNANDLRAPVYARLFPALIEDWRRGWKQPELPFLFVQLANYSANGSKYWPQVRDAQRRTLYLRNTGMAVTIDVGESKNIHPADKQTIAHRLALNAREMVYGEDIENAGPLFYEVSSEPSVLRVWFHHADGLHSSSPTVPGFEIAGADRNFVPATEAHIDGQQIVVSNQKVAKPLYVRYGYQDDPKLDLYNGAQLPASPFTNQ